MPFKAKLCSLFVPFDCALLGASGEALKLLNRSLTLVAVAASQHAYGLAQRVGGSLILIM